MERDDTLRRLEYIINGQKKNLDEMNKIVSQIVARPNTCREIRSKNGQQSSSSFIANNYANLIVKMTNSDANRLNTSFIDFTMVPSCFARPTWSGKLICISLMRGNDFCQITNLKLFFQKLLSDITWSKIDNFDNLKLDLVGKPHILNMMVLFKMSNNDF